jgi:hypothetical protein
LSIDYSGYDPYDALRAHRMPHWVMNHRLTRQLAIQVRRRLPFPLQGLLGIRPFTMVKALGCFLAAEARLATVENPAGYDYRLQRATALMELLVSSPGCLGGGAWGYEFDVQTRWAYYPTGSPNLIATVFVAMGQLEASLAFDQPNWLDLAVESGEYLSQELRSETRDGRPYFRYTATTQRLVHNANLLGAALLSVLGSLTRREQWCSLALDAARLTATAQREDGSWAYGEGPGLAWSDNFHTAYNLSALHHVWLVTRDGELRASLDAGIEHWRQDFFGPSGEPKYFRARPFPYDIHSAATAVDVASRLATNTPPLAALANKVAAWTRGCLIDPSTGATRYRRGRFFTDRRHFVRWGDAHWALGSSSLAVLGESRKPIIDSALEGD